MNTATAVKAATAGTVKLTIRQWATEDRPSVKLQMYGVKSLSDAELLAILIGSGTSKNTAVDIAQNLLDKFDQNLQSACSRRTRQTQAECNGSTQARYGNRHTYL